MKSIQPKEDLVIAGVLVSADSDPILMDNEAADALIEAGQAEEADDLDRMKLDELKQIVAAETVPIGDHTLKADIAADIREHRALSAA